MPKPLQRRARSFGVLLGALVAAAALPAAAQESTDMPAAVQPGLEVLMVRQRTMHMRMDDKRPGGFGDIDHTVTETELAYGLTRDVALMVHVPLEYRDLEFDAPDPDADGFGVGDIPVMLQWRFFKRDTGAIETQRASLLAGVEVPSYDAGFSSESFDPLLGVVYTQIEGRHGVNASALWKFNTGSGDGPSAEFGDSIHDALRVDGSYLYRLSPAAYTAQTTGSHYAQFQLLGRYETNGDTSIHAAPGYMYEGQQWAFEATVHLPVWQEVDHRPELVWGLTLGVRLLF